MFNDGGYFEMVENGTLNEIVDTSKHPSAPKAPVPHCTESQMVKYTRNDGVVVAEVHQYVLTNGELAASGLPDPKRLLHDGKRYHVRSQKQK